LRPEFHLRADRFYNAPDTELDFTEQGGLMWGSSAVGKLVKGADPLHPGIDAFVDDEAGPEIAEKVKRRLQHFIDRKVATLFEPLIALQKDEALTGLARGFAFRLVESLGILPRDGVTAEVKDLDQESRGLLRKHGVRFGQFTVFMPALLKPAPTRLRLVLWSLAEGLAEFPESPPPGLVTIPHLPDVPRNHYTLSGYHPAGDRAIRIDMLERLADLIRTQDTRAGFEANPDMLSITGMTLEQFAGLMEGLGYAAEKGERVKTRPDPVVVPEPAPEGEPAAILTEEESVLAAETRARWEAEQAARKAAEAESAALEGDPAPQNEGDGEAAEAGPEMETFYTFRWAPKPRGNRRPQRDGQGPGERRGQRGQQPRAEGQGDHSENRGDRPDRGERKGRPPRGEQSDRPDRGGKPKGGFKGKGGPKGGHQGAKTFSARPDRPEKKIDPDNPFAVLAALKDKS
ncbi:MAG: disulfide oxidoreductase, partial [Paracoccus sp. (in: a-proteobacteria)]|nr:disulfide oxidoreductase [Paracoccus sp. (in: a-proteobacteria)]